MGEEKTRDGTVENWTDRAVGDCFDSDAGGYESGQAGRGAVRRQRDRPAEPQAKPAEMDAAAPDLCVCSRAHRDDAAGVLAAVSALTKRKEKFGEKA